MKPRFPTAPVVLVFLVVLVLLAAGATMALEGDGSRADGTSQLPEELVEPVSESNVIWPYTSRSRSSSGRTLALNLFFEGDPDAVRFYLSQRVGATWNETEEEWQDASVDEGPGGGTDSEGNGTLLEWAHAEGATRYTYVHNYSQTSPTSNGSIRRPHRAQRIFPGQLRGTDAGRWIDESYQLHDGTYFGHRHHLRVYESPFEDDRWVAVQAHSEHWDWFRLRHTVDGLKDAQTQIEREFMGRTHTADVWRMYAANEGVLDADGWVSVVALRDIPIPRTLSAIPALLGVLAVGVVLGGRRPSRPLDGSTESSGTPPGTDEAGARRLARLAREHGREDRTRTARVTGTVVDRIGFRRALVALRTIRLGLLFLVLFGLYVAVRSLGIFLESNVPLGSPRVVAATLWIVLALGLPTAAYVLGRFVDPLRSFVFSSAGIATAIVVDYGTLGVDVLPIEVAIHRVALAIGIGLIAAGATHPEGSRRIVNRAFGSGVLVWVFMMVGPIVGWI